jgi:FAD/FMN-containing dehydrogenase
VLQVLTSDPDSIFKLPLNNTPTTLQTLRERYDELSARSDTLPYEFNLRKPPEFDVETALNYLPSGFFNTPSDDLSTNVSPPREVNKVAFQMALCGWQGYTHNRLGAQLGSVSCQACFRVLGLWLFKSKAVSEAGEEIKGGIMNSLNIVKEHRDYCPWRNPASQNGLNTTSTETSTALAGWQVVLRVLKNDHYLRQNGAHNGERPSTAGGGISGSPGANVDEADAKSREEKDKERWARLRRVKSLFDAKGGKKVHKTVAKAEAKGDSVA